jgi:trehalose 6-phosphate synthase
MRACSGVWVAHGAGSADRETVDARDHVRVPPGEESYVVRRLWLSPEEEQGYYYGFANEGFWPLCHVAHARPTFRAEDWRHYQAVNRKFADAVCQEVDTDDPVILVQDYHFALVPRLLRERLPRATILTFWHIPWPNAEQISICPWHVELVEGLLGSSILGFHTQFHCNNFLEAADRFLEARIDREDFAVIQKQHRTLIRAYPISVEWPHRWAAAAPPIKQCRSAVFSELGLAPDSKLGVGVDRLDYTKGIEERFRAVERLLEREPQWCGRFTFLQIASPSRTAIERYQQLNRDVEQLVERINGRFATPQWKPIVLRRQHTEPPDVFKLYRAADLCYVSSLHDGMNLVAKEYLVARDDEQGALVLSQFTGAARELPEALIVNPYDIEEAASAISAALSMPAEEQRVRIRAMRRLIGEFNIYRWAGRMLLDASRLRRREQVTGLLPMRQADWAART